MIDVEYTYGGQKCLIEAQDIHLIRKISNLDQNGYLYAVSKPLHYWILGPPPVGLRPDHINRDKLDNRRSNLRFVTHGQNLQNSGPRPKKAAKSSQYKGVYWHKQNYAWTAVVTVNYRNIHLGGFATEEQAALAYNRAARKYFGINAYQNEV